MKPPQQSADEKARETVITITPEAKEAARLEIMDDNADFDAEQMGHHIQKLLDTRKHWIGDLERIQHLEKQLSELRVIASMLYKDGVTVRTNDIYIKWFTNNPETKNV